MTKKLIGVDIGTNEVKLASGRGSSLRVNALRLPDNLLHEGEVSSPEALAKCLSAAVQRTAVRGRDCGLVLPQNQVYCRRLVLPLMTEEQLKLNLPYEFRDYVSAPAKYFFDYALEGITLDENGQPSAMEIMAAAVAKTTIKDYSLAFRKAGLRLRLALPQEMVYRRLLRAYEKAVPPPEPGQEREYCIVDIGHSFTRISIFRGAKFQMNRGVELGCGAADEAIAAEYHVDPYVANSYKAGNYENALYCQSCRDVYHRIATETVKAVNFYRFSNRDNGLNDLFFSGGGAEIQPLLEAITATTALQPHLINDLIGLPPQRLPARCALALGMTLE